MARTLTLGALALALLVATSAKAHAQDDGLPPLPSKTAAEPRTVPDSAFDQIVYQSCGATLTITPGGLFQVDYPGGFVSSLLDSIGVPVPHTVAVGHATSGELAALTDYFSRPVDINELNTGGPLYDNHVLSKEPFELAVEKHGQAPITFSNNGKPTVNGNLVAAAAVLNGIIDRATDGSIYGRANTIVEGTLEQLHDSKGKPAGYAVVDDKGHETLLSGAAGETDGYTAGKRIGLPGFPLIGIQDKVGQRVVVHGIVDDVTAGVTTLVPTRDLGLSSAPAATGPSLGLTGAVSAASGKP